MLRQSSYICSAISVTGTCHLRCASMKRLTTLLVDHVIPMESSIVSTLYASLEKLKYPWFQSNILVRDIRVALDAALLGFVLSCIGLGQITTISYYNIRYCCEGDTSIYTLLWETSIKDARALLHTNLCTHR